MLNGCHILFVDAFRCSVDAVVAEGGEGLLHAARRCRDVVKVVAWMCRGSTSCQILIGEQSVVFTNRKKLRFLVKVIN